MYDPMIPLLWMAVLFILCDSLSSSRIPLSIKYSQLHNLSQLIFGIHASVLSKPLSNLLVKPRLFICLCAGYKVPLSQYESYLTALELLFDSSINVTKILCGSDDKTMHDNSPMDFSADVRYLRDRLSEEGFDDKCNLILVGHSRGGAALTTFVASTENLSSFTNSKRICLILFDPVDSTENEAIKAISRCKTFPSTLIINTPFGGKSTYYNTLYESSCAPPQRSAITFFNAIASLANSNPVMVTFSYYWTHAVSR